MNYRSVFFVTEKTSMEWRINDILPLKIEVTDKPKMKI